MAPTMLAQALNGSVAAPLPLRRPCAAADAPPRRTFANCSNMSARPSLAADLNKPPMSMVATVGIIWRMMSGPTPAQAAA